MSAIIFGDLPVDCNLIKENQIVKTPGGPPSFISAFMMSIDTKIVIASSYGKDFPKINFLKTYKKTRLLPDNPNCEKSLIYFNIDTKKGRVQFVRHADCNNYNNLVHIIENNIGESYDFLFVTPLLSYLNVSEVRKLCNLDIFKNSLKILSPQGFFRQLVKADKAELQKIACHQEIFKKTDNIFRVSKREWSCAFETISLFDLVIFSDEDINNADKFALSMLKQLNKKKLKSPLIIITKNRLGCTVFNKSKIINYKALDIQKNQIVDYTGAGDIFTAAFSYAYRKTGNIDLSAIFANLIAGFSLTFSSIEATKTIKLDKMYRFAVQNNIDVSFKKVINIR